MSDTDTQAPADPTFSSNSDGVAEAADDIRRRRAAGDLGPPAADEPEPQAPRLTDGGKDPLTVRQAARGLGKDREAFAKAAREALGEGADAAADGGQREAGDAGRAGETAAEQPPVVDPDANLRAALEAQAQAYEQQIEYQHRIATLSPEMQARAQLVTAAEAEFTQAFGDIEAADAAGKQRFAAAEPERFRLWAVSRGVLEHGMKGVYAALEKNAQAGAYAYEQQAREYYGMFQDKHPELKNPAIEKEFWADAYANFADHGIGKEEVDGWFKGHSAPRGFDPRIMSMVKENIEARRGKARAEASLANGKVKEMKPVNRPGMRGPDHRLESAIAQEQKALRDLDRNPSGQHGLRAAAALTQARRRAGRL